MLRDSVIAVVVVRTRPRAKPLAMSTMRKSTHGFTFLSYMSMGLGSPSELCYDYIASLNLSLFTGASHRLEPVIKYCLFLSFFQCLVCRASALLSLLEAIEGIPDKDYNYFFGNDKFSNLYKRLLHERKLKSGYLERRIYERPLKSEPNFIENQNKANIFQNYLFINLLSLVKRKFIHCDF